MEVCVSFNLTNLPSLPFSNNSLKGLSFKCFAWCNFWSTNLHNVVVVQNVHLKDTVLFHKTQDFFEGLVKKTFQDFCFSVWAFVEPSLWRKAKESIYLKRYQKKKSVQPTKLKRMGRATWSRYTYLQDRPPIQARGAHVYHAVAWHSGGWSVINVVRFKDDFTLRWHGNSITISQGQCFVIVENTVEIFDPDSIHWSV